MVALGVLYLWKMKVWNQRIFFNNVSFERTLHMSEQIIVYPVLRFFSGKKIIKDNRPDKTGFKRRLKRIEISWKYLGKNQSMACSNTIQSV